MPKEVEVAGWGVVEFPDNMTDAEIKAVLDQQFSAPESLPSSEAPAPAASKPAIGLPRPFFDRSLGLGGLGMGILRGLTEFGLGVEQAGAQALDALFGTDLKRRVDERAAQLAAEWRASPYAQKPAAAGGQIIGQMAVPLALPPARSLAGASLMGAGLGALQYLPEGESRLESAAKGAIFGGLAYGAIKTASGAVARLVNMVRGRMEPAAQEMLDISQRYGVPLAPTDITQTSTPFLTKLAQAAELKPLTGVARFRQQQLEAVGQAADKLARRYNGEILEDWPTIAQASLVRKADRLKRIVGARYDRLEAAANTLGPLPIPKTLQTLDDMIAQESSRIMPNEALLRQLTELRDTLTQRKLDFGSLRDFRSDLGLALKDYYRGSNAVVGEKGAQIYASLRRALDTDMAEWARAQGGSIAEMWRRADASWARLSKVYRDPQIAALKNISDPQTLYEKFKSLAVHKPQLLYEALGPRGQRAIRYGLVREAIRDAARMTPQGEVISATRLASALEKYERQLGVLFGKDRAEIEGFIKLMRAAERSARFAEYPPTGIRAVSPLRAIFGLAALGSAYGGAGVMGAAGVAGSVAVWGGIQRILFTTDAGRRLLLASSRLGPTSEALRRLASEQLPKVIAAHATEEDFMPFPAATNVPPEVTQKLIALPPGAGLYDAEKDKTYVLDAKGIVRVIE